MLDRYDRLLVAVAVSFAAVLLVFGHSVRLYLPNLPFALGLLVSAWRREGFFLARTAAIAVTITYAVGGFLVSVPGVLPPVLWLASMVLFLVASLVIVVGALIDQYA